MFVLQWQCVAYVDVNFLSASRQTKDWEPLDSAVQYVRSFVGPWTRETLKKTRVGSYYWVSHCWHRLVGLKILIYYWVIQLRLHWDLKRYAFSKRLLELGQEHR
jgi:hypothetical protein